MYFLDLSQVSKAFDFMSRVTYALKEEHSSLWGLSYRKEDKAVS